MSRKIALLALLLTLSFVAHAATKLSIVTPNGSVSFVAADDWTALNMQTKMPIGAAVFQIPNPADAGTPDSTNLVILLYDNSERARDAFKGVPKTYSEAPPVPSDWNGWTVWRQESVQGDTRYTILDAKRASVADVAVSVRLAWPHLATNNPNHDREMEALFRHSCCQSKARLARTFQARKRLFVGQRSEV